MSEKQLTVAELLAKAGREGEGGGEETPRRRRRRSVDSGGVSVAELTGRIPKVEAKPTESRHSSSPLDAEETTYTGPFSAVASNSLFGDSPTEAGHVTSLFDDHGDIGQDGRGQAEHSDPSEPPATLSFFSKTDNPGGAIGDGHGGSGGSGVSGGPISGGAGNTGGIAEWRGLRTLLRIRVMRFRSQPPINLRQPLPPARLLRPAPLLQVLHRQSLLLLVPSLVLRQQLRPLHRHLCQLCRNP